MWNLKISEKLKYSVLICSLGLSSIVTAGIVAENKVPGFKLKLDEETYFSDTLGVFNPQQVCDAEIGRLVRMYRTDGFCYTGRVTETEQTEKHYKVYGTINNVDNTQFGFVLAKGGIFAGAIVENDTQITYVLKLSEAHKGFILVKSFAKKAALQR